MGGGDDDDNIQTVASTIDVKAIGAAKEAEDDLDKPDPDPEIAKAMLDGEFLDDGEFPNENLNKNKSAGES